jgi:hypothetical protein
MKQLVALSLANLEPRPDGGYLLVRRKSMLKLE